MMKLDNKQFASRKYQLALLGMILIITGMLLSTCIPGIQVLYPEFVAGILGVLMLYFTGNVGNKFVVGRYLVERSKQHNEEDKKNGTNS